MLVLGYLGWYDIWRNRDSNIDFDLYCYEMWLGKRGNSVLMIFFLMILFAAFGSGIWFFHVCLFNTNGLCSFQFYRPKKQMFALRDGLSQIQEIEDCISTSALNYKSIILKTWCYCQIVYMFKKLLMLPLDFSYRHILHYCGGVCMNLWTMDI